MAAFFLVLPTLSLTTVINLGISWWKNELGFDPFKLGCNGDVSIMYPIALQALQKMISYSLSIKGRN